jgi:hypothetical protein
MSIVVRLSPTSLTRENYDEVERRLESAGVWPNPDSMDYHVLFGSEGDLRVSEIWDSDEAPASRLVPLVQRRAPNGRQYGTRGAFIGRTGTPAGGRSMIDAA